MATKKLDVKEIITTAVEKILSDEKLKKQFLEEPVKTLEKKLGVDLPDDLVDTVVNGIKAKITADKIEDTLSDAAGLLKKLF